MLNYYENPLEICIKSSNSVFIPEVFLKIDVIAVNTRRMSSPTPVHSIFLPSRSGILSSPTLTFETSPYLREGNHMNYILYKKGICNTGCKAFSDD